MNPETMETRKTHPALIALTVAGTAILLCLVIVFFLVGLTSNNTPPTRSIFLAESNNVSVTLGWLDRNGSLTGELLVGDSDQHNFTGRITGSNVIIRFSGTDQEYLNSPNLMFVGTTWDGTLDGDDLTLVHQNDIPGSSFTFDFIKTSDQ